MMEICKLIASFFVVCIHVPFPGELGRIVSCLARFAVPMFFAISGFFSYRASCGKLQKRIWHIVKLNIVAVTIQIAWNLCATLLYGGTMADWVQTLHIGWIDIVKWLVLNVNPFGWHLWYLASIFVCYVAVWGYARYYGDEKTDYFLLYILCVCLTAVHFLLGEFSWIFGIEVSYEIPRNAVFFGLPMFTLGMFLRQYGECILEKIHLTTGKSVLLLLTSATISVLESRYMGNAELYLSTIVTVVILMLLSMRHRQLCTGIVGDVINRFGAYSTVIYIVHMVVHEYYMGMQQYGIYLRLGELEMVLRPLIIITVSLLIAVGVDCCVSIIHLRK